MPSYSIEPKTLRILCPDGKIAGTGFLVASHLAVTCAHVVEIADAFSGGTIQVQFSGQDEIINALVEPDLWRDVDEGDVAFLRLDSVPDEIHPSQLALAQLCNPGSIFRSFGYAKAADVEGIHVTGTIDGFLQEYQLLQLQSPQAGPGISGAPVFDEARRVVVGMLTKGHAELGRNEQTTFAAPTELLFEICPEIQPSETCPYRGLEAFTAETARFFFGREALTEKLFTSLRQGCRFLAVFGPSGSGKSSVVRAGLMPRLKSSLFADWKQVIMRPAEDPLAQMKTAGLESIENLAGRLILFIDQFEELFAFCQNEQREQRTKFIETLAKALENPNFMLIISMRDDFYSAFNAEAASLAQSDYLKIENVPGMLKPEELMAMIKNPAAKVKLAMEEGLAERIAADLARDGELRSPTLPLLEFALTQLWEKRRDGLLTHEAYHSIGGVTGSLALWADSAYSKLPKADHSLAESLLISLVHPGDEAQGLPDTRRQRTLTEFDETTLGVVKHFVDRRLLVTDAETVELVHDALLREWEKLRTWLNIDRDNLRLREGVTEDARNWDKSNRDEAQLNHRGPRLELALTMSKNSRYRLNPTEQAYLDGCAELREREKAAMARRRKITIASVSVALVIILAILAAWGWTSFNSSKVNATLANNNKSLADTNATAAIKNAQLAAQAATVAVEKANAAETAQANEQLAQSARATAQSNEQIAKNAQATAEYSAAYADSGALKALAISNLNTNYTLSMLLGSESYRILQYYGLAQDKEPDILLSLLQKSIPNLQESKPELGEVRQVLFSPDGNLLVTAGAGGIMLRDTSDLHNVKELKLLSNKAVNAIAFNQDGSIFAAGGSDGIVTMWDAATFSQIMTIPGNGDITSLSFSPDKKLLAVAGSGRIILWKLNGTTDYQRIISISDGLITLVAFRPINQSIVLVSGGQDGYFRFWDLGNPYEPTSISTRNIYFVSTSAIAFNGAYLALGWDNGEIQIYDYSNPRDLYRQNTISTNQELESLAISADNQIIAAGGKNGTIYLYDISDIRTPQLVKTLASHTEQIYSIAFHSKSHYLASGGKDKATVLWDISQNQFSPLWRSVPFEGTINAVAFNPKKNILAVSDAEKKTHLWDMSDPNIPKELPYFFTNALAQNIVFNPDGSRIATFDDYGVVSVWNTNNLVIHPDNLYEFKVGSIQFLAFGNDVLFVNQGVKGIFDISSKLGAKSRVFPAGGNFCTNNVATALSADGNLLAMGDCDLNIWDITNRSQPHLLANNLGVLSNIESVAISSDMKLLATGHLDNSISLWDISQPESPRLLSNIKVGHTRSVSSLAFSPNGKTLASGSVDESIILWDISNPNAKPVLRATLEGHTAPILHQALYFSSDGLSLISASNQEVIVWNLDPQFWLDKACKIAGRNFTPSEWTQYLPGESYRATCPDLPVEP